MAIFQVPNISIAGISACVPENEYNNNNYDWISEKERATLIKTIGVEKKRHAKKAQLLRIYVMWLLTSYSMI